MENIALFFGSIYGCLAIIFGAFGAHALKKKLNGDQLQSFETGVKYQMYHAITLLVLGFNIDGENQLMMYSVYCIIIGTFLFSFSIYGLVFSSSTNKKFKFLGPITPLGGLLLVIGWAMLILDFLG